MKLTGPHERWLHDLRNAVGGISAALMVVEANLQADGNEETLKFVREARAACNRAIEMLHSPPDPQTP